TVTFRESYENREITLRAIIVEPGCVAYCTTEEGNVYASYEEAEAADDYAGVGQLFCHYFGVLENGEVEDAMGDNDLLGNAYYRYGMEGLYPGYQVQITSFYADDGAYGLATQEAWDVFCGLVGGTAEPEQPATVAGFTDVPASAWYAGYVETVMDKGLFSGK